MRTMQLPEKITGENLDDLGFGNELLDGTPKPQSMKE